MRKLPQTLICLTLLAAITPAYAEKSEGPVYVDPAQAQQESFAYRIQGEYRTTVEHPRTGEHVKMAMQIIALGNGEFRAVPFQGGLPGSKGELHRGPAVKGKRKGDKVVFSLKPYDDARLYVNSEGVLIYTDAVAGPDQNAHLHKIHRKSPTLGMEPPEDAIVLFDGTKQSLKQHWREGAEMTESGLLKAGAVTKQEFRDFRLHIEYRVPFKPQGHMQHRGNSGVYILNRYEVQILDSFGLKPANNRNGALYELKAPRINMSYPPLSWQTYDIIFKAPRFNEEGEKIADARITVRHNGVLIHKDIPLPHGTGSRSDMPEQPRGPILLQDHNNPVRFRNIWIVER